MNEQQNIEWKSSWRDEYLQWVCAFANTEGGTLIIGKDDYNSVVGVKDPKKLLEDIPSKIKNLGIICPVRLLEENSKSYLEITVKAYANPISYKGKYYIRSGSTTHELNGAELMEFLLAKSGKTWDDLLVEDATMADINTASIKKYLSDSKGQGRLPDTGGLAYIEILQKLRLADGDKLKRAAIILFGADPNRFFPNCKVMVGRFGEDAEDLKFHEPLEGNVIYLLDEVQKTLNYKFLIRPVDFEGLHRREGDEYPVAALREMLLNALVHKKYGAAAVQVRVFDNRLSIWNEGNLPEGITVDSLKIEHNSRSPNPVLAEACFKAGYIDTWGRGTLKIYKTCAEAGLPEPVISAKDGGIEVTLYKKDYSEKLRRNFGGISEKLSSSVNKNIDLMSNKYTVFKQILQMDHGFTSEKLRRDFGETSSEFRTIFGDKKALLLFLLMLDGKTSAEQAAEKIGVSSRTIESYISELKKADIIYREGADKGGEWKFVNATTER